MSELKVYRISGIEFDSQFYHKSEADKPVQPIELLKPRIMKNGCEYYLAGEVRICIEQAARQIVESNSVYKELDTIIKHQKYKRCLAMAMWCRESLRLMRTYEVTEDFWNLEPGQDAEYFCKKGDFYSKWRKRWLKIAEKFKEASNV